MAIILPQSAAINWGNPVNRSCPLNRGLVGWWLAEHPGNATAMRDIVGGNHGALKNGPLLSSRRGAGSFNRSIKFDGSDDFVQAEDSDALDLTTALSVACWYRIIGSPSVGGLVDKTGAGDVTNACYQLFFDNYTYLRWRIRTSGSDASYNFTAVDNDFHLVVGTYDGATGIVYYENGTQSASYSQTPPSATTGRLLIGTLGSGVYRFPGEIPDVRIWNRVLSADEVTQLRQDTVTGYQRTLNRLTRIIPATSGAAATVAASRSRAVNFGGIGRLSRSSMVNA